MASGTHHGTEQIDQVIVRFAGDSGDGMQLTGDRFTTSSALLGNDLSTFPDFPAEIHAPAGTLSGVSAFQVHISDHDILTPGDSPNVLVAMNPAALRANVDLMAQGTMLIVNSDAFDERSLTKAGYGANPLTDGSLAAYTVYEVPMTSHHAGGLRRRPASSPATPSAPRTSSRSAWSSWLYTRPLEPTVNWITEQFAGQAAVVEANTRAFKAGYDFGETAELFESTYEIRPATFEPGEYVQVTGNTALAWGLITAAALAGLPLFLGSYPITPASDILHELCQHKEFGVRTFQAEDEIAGIGAALGASFGGRPRRHHHQRSRDSTSSPRRSGWPINLELPARHHRRPARRPVHRPAHQDGAGRPAARHVRPPRRGPAADRRGHDRRSTASRQRIEAGPPGRQVPHPGDPALGRLPGQRRRAVDGSRPRRPSAHRPGFATEPNHVERRRHADVSGPTCTTRDAGAAVGPAGDGRAGAPHRRPREGRRHGQRVVRRRQPRAMVRLAAGKVAGIAARHPAGRGRRRDG